ncbi:MAG: glycosyltransferase family 2 protein [Planctomycetota bacterium]|jgi:glycosyltransferase involved in cell wall biosynthesis|nr:glycosyltransferase family 2 protein [Planctomycetota bacterium]
MRVAALIPAYQEEKFIAGVVEKTRRILPDVLVVDDGSEDATAELAAAAGARTLRNPANLGKGASLVIGLDALFAEGFDAVICLDADGQHLPGEIPRFLAAAKTADLVLGSRMGDVGDMPFARRCTNRFTSWLIGRLAGAKIPDSQCGFRLLRREAWRSVTLLGRNYDFEGEMVVAMGRKGLRIAHVPISAVYGDEISAIRPLRDTWRFFRMVWRLWRRREG